MIVFGKSSFPLILAIGFSQASAADTAPYSHGNPTADEQYMLELINRARADPASEGVFLATTPDPEIRFATSFFHVDLQRLKSDFNGYEGRPPMAFNAKLMASSRRHSKDMAKNHFQDHVGSDNSTIDGRISTAGYPWSAISENIYSNLVSSTLFAHAGFNIDWGFDEDGLQDGLGHRKTLMGLGANDFREIGISIVPRTGAAAKQFGKLSITQDFGNQPGSPDFLLGVAYYDVNENGICEPGEGLPSIRVQPAIGSWHAVTSSSGGYAIPFFAASGNSSVTFSGGGLQSPETLDFNISGENRKVDLRIISGMQFIGLVPLDGVAGEKGNDGTAAFRVVRNGPSDRETKVLISLTRTGGASASIDDFMLSAAAPAAIKRNSAKPKLFTITLPAGKPSAEIRFTATVDKKSEPTERAVFSVADSKSYRTGGAKSVTIFIKP